MKYLALVILFFTGVAHAEDFSARVKAGKQSLASPEGQKYEASWGAVMQTILPVCIPLGSTSPANLGKFTFVANVSSTGLVSSVEVEPSTDVSRCFAQHFNNAHLPPPPIPLKDDALFPVADVIEVVP